MFIEKTRKIIKSVFDKVPTEILIFIIAVVSRLPSLGTDIINNDAFLWKERGYQFGSALTSFNLAETAVTYHPGVSLLWSQFIAGKIYTILDILFYKGSLNSFDEFIVNHQIQKVVLVVITSLLITLIYYALKKIIGDYTALVAVLLILFEPMYVGLTRVIHTDALLSLFIFMSVSYFYLAVKQKRKIYKNWYLYIGAFSGSLALLTKSSALFIIGFVFIIVLIDYLKNRNLKVIYTLGYFYAFILLGFILIWPAMWVVPTTSINMYINDGIKGTAINEGHGHVWFGNITQDPGSLFYPVTLVARYSLFLLITSILGLVFHRKYKYNRKEFAMFCGFFIILFLIMISIPTKKLDRYSLPIIFPMSVLSSLFIGYKFKRKVGALIVIFVIIFRLVLFYGLHPNYFAYYSPLVGGFDTGRYVVEPKWLIGYDKVAKHFNDKQEDKDDVIKVAIADHDYLRPFAKFEVLNIKHESERDEADYFVLPVYRNERNEFYKNHYNLEKSNDEITVAGVVYYEIYKNEGKY